MLCHEASKSLCPSKRLEIPAFPLHGRSFKNGVKFSVQTTSRGKLPCRRCSLGKELLEWSPVGLKAITGLVVLVESMKLREAQNKPDRALLRVIHRANALDYPSTWPSPTQNLSLLLFARVGFHPSPKLNSSAAFFETTPWPCAPRLGVPSASAKSQMKLSCIRVL